MYYIPSDERKFGIWVQKGFRGGVKRNKVRRRIREIYRRNKRFLKKGTYLFYIKKKAQEAEFRELLEEFMKITQGAGLWQG
ncbi:ribonuclease P protein component [bacterium]|nr:MAG: ribonuclease P protein component [bacterium]